MIDVTMEGSRKLSSFQCWDSCIVSTVDKLMVLTIFQSKQEKAHSMVTHLLSAQDTRPPYTKLCPCHWLSQTSLEYNRQTILFSGQLFWLSQSSYSFGQASLISWVCFCTLYLPILFNAIFFFLPHLSSYSLLCHSSR